MGKVRVVTLCSGYDSQCLALERLKRNYPQFDYDLVAWSEIEESAIKAHNALFPQWADRNLGDMTKIDWEQVPDFDLLFYSTPCFVAGTLILTKNGYKPIEDIDCGDMVLTHRNNYCKVVRTGKKPSNDIYHINAMCFVEIDCTGNHPFYVRRMYRYGHRSIRAFREPEWVEAKNLGKDCYLGYAINTQSQIPQWDGTTDNRWGHSRNVNKLSEHLSNPTFWYIIGRYIGDGWYRDDKAHKCIVIACSDRNHDTLVSAINNIGLHYVETNERTCKRITINSKELCEFVKRYGKGASYKYIDAETFALPVEQLKSFVDGYIASDGYFNDKDNHYQISTTSKMLAYGIIQCIAKVYHAPCKIYKCNMPRKTFIEGREVNQKDFYIIRFKKEVCKQDRAFYKNGYIWFPISKIERLDKDCVVYNMEVEDNHSYTANGAIVHNCQSVSQAGLQHGFTEGSGTRSSIIWYVREALRMKKPKYAILENVSAMVSKKFIGMFNLWQAELEKHGYSNYAKILNAADYGVPQHRERIFLVSVLGDERYYFPKPIKLTKKLNDVLEDKVAEKYYLPDERVSQLMVEDTKAKIESEAKKMIKELIPQTRGGAITDTDAQRRECRTINDDEHGAPTKQRLEVGGEVSNALTTVQKDSMILGYTRDKDGKVINHHAKKEANTITSASGSGGNTDQYVLEPHIRVRKLTERECFRLMGVDDADIDKIQDAGISRSKQYQLAGNSIVVDVLYHIFRKLFVEPQNEDRQLQLF